MERERLAVGKSPSGDGVTSLISISVNTASPTLGQKPRFGPRVTVAEQMRLAIGVVVARANLEVWVPVIAGEYLLHGLRIAELRVAQDAVSRLRPIP